MRILDKIIRDIIELERFNMTPILNNHGKEFNEFEILADITTNNFGLRNLFCVYSKNDILEGYFRYNFDEEGNVIVRSIQINPNSANFSVLKKLLCIAYMHLRLLKEEILIYAWVNNGNTPSFNLLRKLNFKFGTGNRDASKFIVSKSTLLATLIKIGFYNIFSYESHPGNFPIRVLQHNLPYDLVTYKPYIKEKLERIILEGKINSQIEYLISDEFSMIQVDINSKKVRVSEQFLAFIWSFIYSTFVIVNEGIYEKVKANNSRFWNGKIDASRSIVKRAQELYTWSKSLPKGYSNWPLHLPNPEIFYNAEEQYYIEKVNGIYLKAVIYLLNHEIAHLINNHFETVKDFREKQYFNLTDEERSLYKMIENEADQFAREEIVEDDDTDESKIINGLSIILAHCASLFVINHPSDLESNFHPDIDNRIAHSINFLNIQDKEKKGYLYLVAALSINLFFEFNRNEFEASGFGLQVPSEVEDPREYFNECLRIIDGIKKSYRGMN
jgi:hypothetical protein